MKTLVFGASTLFQRNGAVRLWGLCPPAVFLVAVKATWDRGRFWRDLGDFLALWAHTHTNLCRFSLLPPPLPPPPEWVGVPGG